MKIAILATCFNRKKATICCIESLKEMIKKDLFNEYKIYLCDDASTDGTAEQVAVMYPDIILIQSKGNLYWCKGMYEVMKCAFEDRNDLYLMINDDVEFYNNMLEVMINSYLKKNKVCGIVGTTISKNLNLMSYGGRVSSKNLEIIKPNTSLPKCGVANWNCFLIPHEVIEKVGLIDRKYAHSYGDFDYSMCMERKKIYIYVASEVIGTCERNSIEGTYLDRTLTRKKRFQDFFSKKGVPFLSHIHYYFKNYGYRYLGECLIVYLTHIKKIIFN